MFRAFDMIFLNCKILDYLHLGVPFIYAYGIHDLKSLLETYMWIHKEPSGEVAKLTGSGP